MENYRIHYRRSGGSQDVTFDILVRPPYPTINFGTTTTITGEIVTRNEQNGYGDRGYGDGEYGFPSAYSKYEDISAYQYRGSTALTQGGIVSYSDPINSNDLVDSNVIRLEPLVSGQSLPDFWAIVESTQNLTELRQNAIIELQLRPVATLAEIATRSALESSRKV